MKKDIKNLNKFTSDFIVSSKGQLDYPGMNTLIPNANGRITMKGVKQNVLGIDDLGNKKIMKPKGEYQFPGDSVYEIPLKKKGGEFKKGLVTNPKKTKKSLESKKYSRSLSATNVLFTENSLFKKPKSRKNKVYNPNAKYYAEGGSLLTKKVTCKKCGWEWDAADGGKNITTCHKCGGQGLVHAQGGGNTDAMTGMMKARLAYANEFGNPAAERMINLPDNPYQFDNGDTGTHYMASMDNYAVPQIQDENGVLQLGNYGPESNEAIRFDSDEDANYFAENYKDVSPGFINQKQYGGENENPPDKVQDLNEITVYGDQEKRKLQGSLIDRLKQIKKAYNDHRVNLGLQKQRQSAEGTSSIISLKDQIQSYKKQLDEEKKSYDKASKALNVLKKYNPESYKKAKVSDVLNSTGVDDLRNLYKEGKISDATFMDFYDNFGKSYDREATRTTEEDQVKLKNSWYGKPDEKGRTRWMGNPNNVAKVAQAVAIGAPLAAAYPIMAPAIGATLAVPEISGGLNAYFGYHGLKEFGNEDSHTRKSMSRAYDDPTGSNIGDAAWDVGINSLNFLGLPFGKAIKGSKNLAKLFSTDSKAAFVTDNVALDLESQIAKLKEQEVLAEESRKALWSEYKAGNITAEEYTAGANKLYSESNPRFELEAQLRNLKADESRNIIKEIPQQNILKSKEQLGEDVRIFENNLGSNNEGVYDLNNGYVAKLTRHGFYPESDNMLVTYADKIKSPRTAKVLQIKEIDGKVYQVQNKATGIPITELSEAELQNIPKEHIDNFWKDKAELDELGLSIDISGGKYEANIFYDPKKGFQIIDLGIGKSSTNEVIAQTYKGLKLPGSPNIVNDVPKASYFTTLFPRFDIKNLKTKSGKDWIKKWYSDPDFIKKYKETGKIYPEHFQDEALETLSKYEDKNYIDLIKDKGLVTYIEELPSTGLSYGTPNRIYVKNSAYYPFNKFGKESTRVHELTHLLEKNGYFLSDADKSELLKPFIINGVSKDNGTFLQKLLLENKKDYYLHPSEIHARMNQARFHFDLSPGDKFTKEMANEISKLNDFNGMTRYIQDKKAFMDLMNNFWSTPAAVTLGAAGAAGATDLTKKQYKQGGATNDYVELDLTPEEIQKYIDGGYIVEEIN